ncbi:FecR domain-containing protein [Nostoc sp. 'Lobaria pulmonaria (5183) cyanobiont']|uniref:FecR domain-containing protein n=1 Tax=Nostoc sp. 'Lobaria pulmonaria (5183) cyanobiont' TaxID=1618022 RepID=UPI000CF32BEC|nr:FecR domain-containing protein [Nostoc sp. 'Lobaria pulmonaria (5183) cyanobiont']
MFYKSFPLLVIGLWGVIVLPLPNRVSATTPLTRAEIQNLRNIVQLIPKDKLKKRPARKLDAMTPGDGLSTGRASLADLRFNDGSLARVGEQALFQFLPKTRDFKLTNGTVLLLIPPGKGQTRIQTPNAAAAIRGSALFVRYDQQTDTTIVGALTNSGIEVSNKKASETQVLKAGQMVIIVKGEFQRLYDFDLRNFYETSQMVRELDLNRQSPVPTPDPAITSVQAETAAALEAQSPIKGEGVIENPPFMQLTPKLPISPTNPTPVTSTDPTPVTSTDPTPVTSTNPTPVTSTDPTPVTSTNPTPVTSTNPTPVTSTNPTPVTSTNPTPVTSTNPTPVTPTNPTSVTPTNPTPVTPTNPTPVTPTNPTPVTPTNPTSVTPTNPTPVTPTNPTPVTPTNPTPVTSIDPTPVTSIDPTRVTPTNPTPITPTNPTPVTPTNPTPVTSIDPTRVTPTNPTPVTPTNPTPVTPTNPTPVTPTDSPST